MIRHPWNDPPFSYQCASVGIVMSFNEYINRRDLDELSRLMTDDHVLLIPPIARSRARRRVSKLGEDLSPPSGLSQSPRARSVIE
jgi:hypothetical protein